ncbi:MAG: 50S ribosomal protein L15 [Deltaproteobacteria bacterium CG_4_9_14_3_um_filter_44_9]|nr:MAG: 50S ribosomal protein L15 [Deltaproteobacteria bacterium CG06_land_8_20_14_3_00_44_19]PJB40514.1 MAG: 50S ribosomal protein L15 [Deltaproteobacteria bacterium CG_4_9_14_3_um_filter_44_9]
MRLIELKPSSRFNKRKKRVGRGQGSGHGQTACSGSKGQRSRSGRSTPPGFEGGQMPLKRRLPKRGFTNIFKKKYVLVNIRDLNVFEEGTVVDDKALIKCGLIKGAYDGIKVLGDGEISYPLTVKVHRFSKPAKDKIEAVGGKIEVV